MGPLTAILFLAVFSGQLDGAFIGLRAGIAQKHLAVPCQFAQAGGKFRLDVAVIQVGDMLQPGRLAGYRLYPSVVAVSQAVDADTAGKINIFLAFRINGVRTLT